MYLQFSEDDFLALAASKGRFEMRPNNFLQKMLNIVDDCDSDATEDQKSERLIKVANASIDAAIKHASCRPQFDVLSLYGDGVTTILHRSLLVDHYSNI